LCVFTAASAKGHDNVDEAAEGPATSTVIRLANKGFARTEPYKGPGVMGLVRTHKPVRRPF
jgi:hypothetical protein